MLDIDSQKTKIRWNKETRSPFVVVRTDVLECHQGPDRSKQYNQRRKANSIPQEVGKSHDIRRIEKYCYSRIHFIVFLRFSELINVDFRKISLTYVFTFCCAIQIKDHYCAPTRLMIQQTKKVYCKATLSLLEVITFRDFQVENLS